MGGFSWSIIVEREEGIGVEAAIKELEEWAQKASNLEDEKYYALRLCCFVVLLPKQADDIFEWRGVTYRKCFPEFYNNSSSIDDKVLLYFDEIPWLWKIPPAVMVEAARCFSRNGVLNVWWRIIRDGHSSSEQFVTALEQQLSDLGLSCTRDKYPRDATPF
jgi:hypothetical protein